MLTTLLQSVQQYYRYRDSQYYYSITPVGYLHTGYWRRIDDRRRRCAGDLPPPPRLNSYAHPLLVDDVTNESDRAALERAYADDASRIYARIYADGRIRVLPDAPGEHNTRVDFLAPAWRRPP